MDSRSRCRARICRTPSRVHSPRSIRAARSNMRSRPPRRPEASDLPGSPGARATAEDPRGVPRSPVRARRWRSGRSARACDARRARTDPQPRQRRTHLVGRREPHRAAQAKLTRRGVEARHHLRADLRDLRRRRRCSRDEHRTDDARHHKRPTSSGSFGRSSPSGARSSKRSGRADMVASVISTVAGVLDLVDGGSRPSRTRRERSTPPRSATSRGQLAALHHRAIRRRPRS
jgi:hypothetical protein